MYYIEYLDEIFQALAANIYKPPVVITVVDHSLERQIRHLENTHSLPQSNIVIVPNEGRNLGPLAILLEKGILEPFDVIGHLHTKKTIYAEPENIAQWRRFLIGNLIGSGSEPQMCEKVIKAFDSNQQLGIVFPDDPLEIGWGENLEFARQLVTHLDQFPLPESFKFPAGSMFWARKTYLDKCSQIGLSTKQLPQEPLPMDGSELHALERLLGIAPEYFGFDSLLVRVDGIPRYPQHFE